MVEVVEARLFGKADMAGVEGEGKEVIVGPAAVGELGDADRLNSSSLCGFMSIRKVSGNSLKVGMKLDRQDGAMPAFRGNSSSQLRVFLESGTILSSYHQKG